MATILCVDDDEAVGRVLEQALRGFGHTPRIATSVAGALEIVGRVAIDLIITDYRMPGTTGLDLLEVLEREERGIPVIIMTGYSSVEHAVTSMRHGAIDYLTKPIRSETLRIAVNQALAVVRLQRENDAVKLELQALRSRQSILGESAVMRGVLDTVATVAPTRTTVLLQGESGTGKELIARALHDQSSRHTGPFITLNCAALPEGLVESALFGHEKGAFTGAIGRVKGAFERADGGTLLLDEISEMRLDLQAKLLRVIQEQEFERVGGDRPIRVDVRLVATTNRDLAAEVKEGRFREDLFYRISVVPIRLPPLAERRQDIPMLVHHFAERAAAQLGVAAPEINPAVLAQLQARDWPGNVRQLANVVERGVVLGGGRSLAFEALLDSDVSGARDPALPSPVDEGQAPPAEGVLNLRDLEANAIERALARTGGNRTRAAELLGITDRTLRNKLNKGDGDSR